MNGRRAELPASVAFWAVHPFSVHGGLFVDPFAGSGTTGCAACFENIGEIVLMEMDKTYIPIIEARTKYWSIEKNRFNYLEEIRLQKQEIIENQMKLF